MNNKLIKYLNVLSGRKRLYFLKLFRLIWNDNGITRNELMQKTGLSKTKIINDVNILIKQGILQEGAFGYKEAGRRPATLHFKPDSFFTIGIDLYGEGFYSETVNVGIYNAACELISEAKIEAKSDIQSPDTKLAPILKLISKLLKENNISGESILCYGCALPGFLKYDTGEIKWSSAFYGNGNFQLGQFFYEHFGKRCFPENDANLFAVAEKRWGQATDMKNFLRITDRCGMGIFINERLFRGQHGFAGEFGAMQINERGPLGKDGRVGTVESLASFRHIFNSVNAVLQQDGYCKVKDFMSSEHSHLRLDMIIKAANAGDPLCERLFNEYFDAMGRGIINLVYLFDPEAVFLPAWINQLSENYLNRIKKIMGHLNIHYNWEQDVKILSADERSDKLVAASVFQAVDTFFETEINS